MKSAAWIAIALDDLAAARLLHANRLYPQAVFQLQQSVEKALKGVGAFASLGVSPKKIGHESLRVANALGKKAVDETIPVWNSIRAEAKLAPIEAQDLIARAAADRERHLEEVRDARHLSLDALDRLIGLARRADGHGLTRDEIAELAATMLVCEFELRGVRYPLKDNLTLVIDLLNLHIRLAAQFLPAWQRLESLARALPALHVTATRYGEDDLSPRQVYTRKHPLVLRAPNLFKLQKEALDALAEVFRGNDK